MTSQELEIQIQKFKKIVPTEITKTRWEHSIRVAEIAKELAIIHSKEEAGLAYLAGIVHDITKQKTSEFHKTLFLESGQNELEQLPSAAWHAYSAAIYLKSQYNLQNEKVVIRSKKSYFRSGNSRTFRSNTLRGRFFRFGIRRKKSALCRLERTS